jgi:DNA-binding GntR family transcriptional regulator
MMLNPNSSKPLYEQIREYLLLNIQSGVFPPHSRIPSERELAEQFKVSRLTASKAIKELVQAGML